MEDFVEVHWSRLLVIPAVPLVVVGGARPANESGGGVFVWIIVVSISYWRVLPREFVWRWGRRRRAIVVVDEQLTGGWHGAKWIIVRRERVKVKPKLGSANTVCLSDEGVVVDVVFGGRSGRFAGELLFLERLNLSLCLSGGDHCGSGSDDSVGRTTSPLWK